MSSLHQGIKELPKNWVHDYLNIAHGSDINQNQSNIIKGIKLAWAELKSAPSISTLKRINNLQGSINNYVKLSFYIFFNYPAKITSKNQFWLVCYVKGNFNTEIQTFPLKRQLFLTLKSGIVTFSLKEIQRVFLMIISKL